MLTDQLPPPAFARKVNPQNFAPPRQFNPRISVGVEQVIASAMALEKQDRYQSAAEMAQAILALGFSFARNSGNIRPISGPNAVTIASTQPGSYLPGSTIHPAPTQVGGPTTPTPAQWAAGNSQPTPARPLTPSSGTVQSVAPQPTISSPTQTGPTGNTATPPGPSRRKLLIGGGALVVAAAGYMISPLPKPWSPAPSPVSAGKTVTVNFAYSTEKAAWLQAVTSTFNQNNHILHGSDKVIQVQLGDLGSVDGQARILQGQLKPVAWSPASNLEINRLNYQWQQAHKGAALIDYSEQYQPRSLVKSPLVLASWQQRAQALLRHFNAPALDWDMLATAFQASDWTQVGGQAGWGPVKFGHTRKKIYVSL